MDYTGFKLGEKKQLKDKESYYHTNVKRVSHLLNVPVEQNPIQIDWQSFSAAVTSENMRPYLGDAVYDRWCGGIATDLETFSNQPNCQSILPSKVKQIQLKGKEETVNPGEIQFDQEKGIVIITVNGKRTGNNYELGFLTNFFNNNLRAESKTFDADLSGFTITEALLISANLHYLTKSNTTLHTQLPSISIIMNFPSFQLNVVNIEHRKYLGSHVCEYYCNGIAEEIVSLCQENSDAKEAIIESIKEILIECDNTNSSLTTSGELNQVTLTNSILLIKINPLKLGFRYKIGTVRTFLENNL